MLTEQSPLRNAGFRKAHVGAGVCLTGLGVGLAILFGGQNSEPLDKGASAYGAPVEQHILSLGSPKWKSSERTQPPTSAGDADAETRISMPREAGIVGEGGGPPTADRGRRETKTAAIPAGAPAKEATARSAADGEAKESKESDARYRQLIVGKWEQFQTGHRLLTVRDDGSATMVVRVDGVWSYAFGERLSFEIEWRIEEGHLKFRMISGEPASKIQLITQMFGRHRSQPIVELTRGKMLLRDPDGKLQESWKRLASE